jgi:hypothetical protein
MRPQNIEPIVRASLKCEFVSKVVVQNNNPDIDILQWVKVEDPRLRIYNSPTRQYAGARWSVAAREGASYYLAIDDDIFLFPSQIARLFERLMADPSVPHGISGVRQATHLVRRDENVDVLCQLYLATAEHVRRFHELLGRLEAEAPEEYAIAQHYGDDIVISQCGESQPRIHNVGLIPMCSSSYTKGVALHQLEDFPRDRLRLLQALRQLNLCCPYRDASTVCIAGSLGPGHLVKEKQTSRDSVKTEFQNSPPPRKHHHARKVH